MQEFSSTISSRVLRQLHVASVNELASMYLDKNAWFEVHHRSGSWQGIKSFAYSDVVHPEPLEIEIKMYFIVTPSSPPGNSLLIPPTIGS